MSGGGLPGEVESCTPTAAELMAFVQQHGLQACSIETVMQVWQEQRQAARRLSSGGPAPAWAPLEQQQQQWEQPAPSMPAGAPSLGAAVGAAWGPAAVQQEGQPQPWLGGGQVEHFQQQVQPQWVQQQPWHNDGQMGQHPQDQMQREPQRFQQQPQTASGAQPGAAAAAAAGGSKSAQKPASQKLKQAVLVAGGRAYAPPDPERPSKLGARLRGCVHCLAKACDYASYARCA